MLPGTATEGGECPHKDCSDVVHIAYTVHFTGLTNWNLTAHMVHFSGLTK